MPDQLDVRIDPPAHVVEGPVQLKRNGDVVVRVYLPGKAAALPGQQLDAQQTVPLYLFVVLGAQERCQVRRRKELGAQMEAIPCLGQNIDVRVNALKPAHYLIEEQVNIVALRVQCVYKIDQCCHRAANMVMYKQHQHSFLSLVLLLHGTLLSRSARTSS